MLRKSPGSNTSVVIFKNANFSQRSLKVTKLNIFQHFFLFKILLPSLLIVVPPSGGVKLKQTKESREIKVEKNIKKI